MNSTLSVNALPVAWDICLLALMIYREARGESYEAQVQVAWTVRNRVENPKWWGRTFSEVLTKPWQYSSLSDPRDPQLTYYPQSNNVALNTCLRIALGVHDRTMFPTFPHADSYFDDSITPPRWATPDKFVGKIGRLNFYNIDGDI